MKLKQSNKPKNLIRQIRTHYELYVDSEGESIENSIILGGLFTKLKKQITEDKKNSWQVYYRENISRPSLRTAQRFMELARYIDINKYPNLKWLKKDHLKKLIDLSGKGEVGEFLDNNDINLDFDGGDYPPVYKFQDQVKKLINQFPRDKMPKQDNGTKAESIRKQFYNYLVKINSQVNSGKVSISNGKLKTYKKIERELSSLIQNCS